MRRWKSKAVIFAVGMTTFVAAICLFATEQGKDFIWGLQRGYSGKAYAGPNGLPLCEEPGVLSLAERAIQNRPGGKAFEIQFFSITNPRFAEEPKAADKQTRCQADTITNEGKKTLHYALEQFSDGRLYVQAFLSKVDDSNSK
jgi:hypothetical protein